MNYPLVLRGPSYCILEKVQVSLQALHNYLWNIVVLLLYFLMCINSLLLHANKHKRSDDDDEMLQKVATGRSCQKYEDKSRRQINWS